MTTPAAPTRPSPRDERPGSEPGASAPGSRRGLLAAAALAGLCALAYAAALGGTFVFDDFPLIRDNALVRDLSAWAPWGPGWRAGPSRWLTNATFALNHRLGGLDPAGYKAVNVAIHLANALLVFALVRVTLRTRRMDGSVLRREPDAVALGAAALFVSHPLQTQAVTYVVQRSTSLATLCYLAAAVAYARWAARRDGAGRWRGAGWYALALVAAVLGMRAKEIAFTLPVALALWETAFGEGARLRRAVALVPLLVTLLIIPASLVDLRRPLDQLATAAAAASNQTDLSRWDYLVTQPAVVSRYLRLLAWPVGQSLDHDQPLYRSLAEPAVLGGLALIGALAALALWLAARSSPGRGAGRALDPGARLAAFGIGWFFVALSVESSVIPIGDLMFEHRVYLPSAGLFAGVAAAAALALARLLPDRWPRVLVAGGLGLSILLAAASAARNRVWTDEVSLWTDAAAKAPEKPRPHLNLGHALDERGERDAAIASYLAALRADPAYVSAHANLGIAYVRRGDLERAVAHLRTAIALDPADPEPHNTLGVAYARMGRPDLAAAEIGAALRLRAAGARR